MTEDRPSLNDLLRAVVQGSALDEELEPESSGKPLTMNQALRQAAGFFDDDREETK